MFAEIVFKPKRNITADIQICRLHLYVICRLMYSFFTFKIQDIFIILLLSWLLVILVLKFSFLTMNLLQLSNASEIYRETITHT